MVKIKCNHCKFIEETFPQKMSKREYWVMTEVFVYLHGSDYCDHKPKVIDVSTKDGKEYLMPNGTN